LRDGTKKMSKSDPSDQSRINLSDDADTIAAKIRRARTDAEPLPSEPAGLEGRAEARNLVGIYAALAEYGGQGFAGFKDALAALTVAKLSPIGAETKRLLAEPGHIDRLLFDGAARAEAIANPIVAEAERLVGFLQRPSETRQV
jgi:tryptophanyl-tRNA synthetase